MGINLRRGDVVICPLAGDYGKARPAVIIQSDLFNPTHASIVVCPITSHLIDAPLFRIPLEPHLKNGIEVPSQIMIDKMSALKREKIKKRIGTLSTTEYVKLQEGISLWLDCKE